MLSNATNYSDAVSSGVDPRTGAFTFALHLAELSFAKTSGLVFKLRMSYNAASSLDLGFGRGWGLALARFDKNSNLLTLTTGQQFKIKWNTQRNEYDVPYRRLKDVRVLFEGSSAVSHSRLKVLHKDGRTEYIDYDKGCLEELVSPVGHSIFFDHWNSNARLFLWRIRESSDGKSGHTVFIDNWTHRWKTTLIRKFNDSEINRISFDLSGAGSQRRLHALTLPGNQIYRFAYRYSNASGYDLIEEVNHPTGLRERCRYLDAGHSLQSGAPIAAVPYVTEHWLYAGLAQPDRYATYHYSDKNYLGFGSSASWVAGEDVLFNSEQDYRYCTTEVVNGIQKTVRTYNKYHLLEKSAYYHYNVLYKEEVMTYFAVLSQKIDYQPATYSLLKSMETRHIGEEGIRSVKVSYDYDDYGNQISVNNADGSKVIRVFYPASGEVGKCPEEPNGFVSLLKTESFSPAVTANGEVPRHTHFDYLKLARLGTYGGYAVLIRKVTDHSGETEYSYYNSSINPYEYGRIKKIISTYRGHISRESISYRITQDTLTTIRLVEHHDKLQTDSSETLTFATEKITQTKDYKGYITLIDYDEASRKIRETVAWGTPSQATTVWDYSVGLGANTVMVSDAFGNQQRQTLNNAGNPIYEEVTDEHGNFYFVSKFLYNSDGKLKKKTQLDYLEGRELSVWTKFKYDKYGEVSEVYHQDGRRESVFQDHVALTHTHTMQGLLETVTVYDNAGRKIRKELRGIGNSRNLFIKTDYRYNGYGNLIAISDTSEHLAFHAYDHLDRIVSTSREIDGFTNKICYHYANFSSSELLTEIMVNEIVLGKQNFDGLERITSKQTFGAETQYHYSGVDPSPTAIITPNGDIIRYENHPFFDIPITRKVGNSPSLDTTYNYDPVSGELLCSLNISSKHARVMDKMGRLTSERVIQKDGVERQASYRYSLQGKPVYEQTFFDDKIRYHYDQHGRLERLETESGGQNLETQIHYDSHSRPVIFKTSGHSHSAGISLTLNSIGLEVERMVYVNGRLDFTLTQVFNNEFQLVQRILSEGGGVTTESMSYDSLHRLVAYRCSGLQLPADEQGNRIREQKFSYDTLGNIIRVYSKFSDGTTDRAQYTYSASNPLQLERVTHTHRTHHSSLWLSYDASGNLLTDEMSRSLVYNALGQLESISQGGHTLSDYYFNAEGRLVSQSIEGELVNLFYKDGLLINESTVDTRSFIHSAEGRAISRTLISGGKVSQTLILSNAQNSVIKEVGGTSSLPIVKQRIYTPYGQG